MEGCSLLSSNSNASGCFPLSLSLSLSLHVCKQKASTFSSQAKRFEFFTQINLAPTGTGASAAYVNGAEESRAPKATEME